MRVFIEAKIDFKIRNFILSSSKKIMKTAEDSDNF